MNVRANTVVVGKKPGRPLAWPTERAALINKQTKAVAEERAAFARELRYVAANARKEAANALLSRVSEDMELTRYMLRAAAEQLGRNVGKEIERWAATTVDPLLGEQMRIRRHALNAAVMSVRAYDSPLGHETEAVMTVEAPPLRVCVATLLPW